MKIDKLDLPKNLNPTVFVNGTYNLRHIGGLENSERRLIQMPIQLDIVKLRNTRLILDYVQNIINDMSTQRKQKA